MAKKQKDELPFEEEGTSQSVEKEEVDFDEKSNTDDNGADDSSSELAEK